MIDFDYQAIIGTHFVLLKNELIFKNLALLQDSTSDHKCMSNLDWLYTYNIRSLDIPSKILFINSVENM